MLFYDRKDVITMDDCIFCKIISGEIPSATIFEDKEFQVILDRFPSGNGHTLILPKKHYANIFEIDPQVAGRLFQLAVKVAAAVKKTTNCDGMNILQNNGTIAVQTVNHFHLHIIPRFENDTVTIAWAQQNPTDASIEEIKQAITANL